MNESVLCYSRVDVCMYGCNEIHCDETTNATSITFGSHIPRDNRNRVAKIRKKKFCHLCRRLLRS
jgi:hypothetical protein